MLLLFRYEFTVPMSYFSVYSSLGTVRAWVGCVFTQLSVGCVFTQLSVQCCFTSTETVWTIRDGGDQDVHTFFRTAPEL